MRGQIHSSNYLQYSFILNILARRAEGLLTNTGDVDYGESSVYFQPQERVAYLEELYIFKNPKEIKEFLIRNDDMIEVLIEAPENIRRIFGEFPIYLELHHDPEEDWDELFIVIKSDYSPQEAVELEDRFFEEWFANLPDRIRERLNFTEEPL